MLNVLLGWTSSPEFDFPKPCSAKKTGKNEKTTFHALKEDTYRETGPSVLIPEIGRRQNQSNNKREFSTKSSNAKEVNLVEEEKYTPKWGGDVDASESPVTESSESKSSDPLEQTLTLSPVYADSTRSESKSAATETEELHEYVPKAVVDFGGRDSRRTSFKTKETSVTRGAQSTAASYTTREPSRTASVVMLGAAQDVCNNPYSPNMDIFMFSERNLTGAMFPTQNKRKESSKAFDVEPVREKEVEDRTSRQRESDNRWKPQPILFGGKFNGNKDVVVEQPMRMSELTKTKKAAQKKTVGNKSNLMTINENVNPFEGARDRSDHVIKELGQEKDDPLSFFDKSAFKLPTYHRIMADNQSELSGLINFD